MFRRLTVQVILAGVLFGMFQGMLRLWGSFCEVELPLQSGLIGLPDLPARDIQAGEPL